MSPRKSVPQELSRKMILNASQELFVQKGYQHVSMREIAKKLNYSHGAIYYHFKNKAELFYALVEDHFRMLDGLLDAIMEQELNDSQKLRQILVRFIQFGLSHQSHYEIMFLTKDEEVRNFINEGPSKSYQKFANNVQLLCGKRITIQEIWSLFLSLHGFVVHYLGHVASYEDIEDLANAHVNFLQKTLS